MDISDAYGYLKRVKVKGFDFKRAQNNSSAFQPKIILYDEVKSQLRVSEEKTKTNPQVFDALGFLTAGQQRPQEAIKTDLSNPESTGKVPTEEITQVVLSVMGT